MASSARTCGWLERSDAPHAASYEGQQALDLALSCENYIAIAVGIFLDGLQETLDAHSLGLRAHGRGLGLFVV